MNVTNFLLEQRFSGSAIVPNYEPHDPVESYKVLLPNASPSTYKPIAIVMSHDDDYLEQTTLLHLVANINRLFDSVPEIELLCARHDPNVLSEECFAYITRNAHRLSACVTLSSWTTAEAYRHLTMAGVRLPLLFANVNDPVGLGITKPKQRSKYLSGIVTHTQEYRQQLQTMKDLFPSFRRLIVPYDSLLRGHRYSNVEYGNIAAMIAECDKLSIEPRMLGITPYTDMVTEINSFDSRGTIFAITRESSVMVNAQEIITTGKTKGFPIFSDMPFPTICGGAFGTGSTGVLSALPLAQLIHKVLAEKQIPGEIPLHYLQENSRLLYNQENFAEQGICLDDRTRRLIETQDIATLLYEEL